MILITGPAGSLKTLLAMQLLCQMGWVATAPESKQPPPARFLTCDERAWRLCEKAPRILSVGPSGKIGMGHGSDVQVVDLQSSFEQAGTELLEPSAATGAEEAVRAIPAVERLARQIAVREFVLKKVTELATGVKDFVVTRDRDAVLERGAKGADVPLAHRPWIPTRFRAICVDGLLNLPEFRGISDDERRDALFEMARRLRTLVSPEGGGVLSKYRHQSREPARRGDGKHHVSAD